MKNLMKNQRGYSFVMFMVDLFFISTLVISITSLVLPVLMEGSGYKRGIGTLGSPEEGHLYEVAIVGTEVGNEGSKYFWIDADSFDPKHPGRYLYENGKFTFMGNAPEKFRP